MPELPEVETTVQGLITEVVGYTIDDVWTDYASTYKAYAGQIKNTAYFDYFKREVVGATIESCSRRAKNVLIHLDNGKTILTHMKMTGHYVVGNYKKTDAFNQWIHLLFTLSCTKNGVRMQKHLGLSDVRKFAKVTLVNTQEIIAGTSTELASLGPEPLDPSCTFEVFKARLLSRPHGKLKTILMDQQVLSGIGNIYSDEMAWLAALHPESSPTCIPLPTLQKLYTSMLEVLRKGIDFGGDSMSDYRNIYGERGQFQHAHNAYRRTGKACTYPQCSGTIVRNVIGSRSAHFCDTHQIRYSLRNIP